MRLEEILKTTNFNNETHKALLNLLYTSYWLKTHVSAAIKDQGLTSEQFNVLRILRGKHPVAMCVKDIGERMIEKNSNVPRIVDRLEMKELVERSVSPADKRETLIALTAKGLTQLGAANSAVDCLEKELIGLDDQDAMQLNSLLERLRQGH